MEIISRVKQGPHPAYKSKLDDTVFDGVAIPREIAARDWLREGDVHRSKVLTNHLETTRYFEGPQVLVTRDDIRRTTWAVIVENHRLVLNEISGPRPAQHPVSRSERKLIADGNIWRYHVTLDKYTGKVMILWIDGSEHNRRLRLDDGGIETASSDIDFPFLALSQVAVGRVATEPAKFGILTYKCRRSGKLFVRRFEGKDIGPERTLDAGPILGGASIAISHDRVLLRVDVIAEDRLAPTLIESTDGGRTFGAPRRIDLSGYDPGFRVAPGYTAPTLDKGYGLHVPIFASDANESAALNYVLDRDVLVEAIRVRGTRPHGDLEVFPSTVGSSNTYGDGVSDGHGLIMVLGTQEGSLYSSNSSAGGIYFPDAVLLNHEMPQIAVFDSSECYSSGLRPNYVSMDYIFAELDRDGRIVSPTVHFETWDMPLPLPVATAVAKGGEVRLTIQKDADLEPGKVIFGIDDPRVNILETRIEGLRTAVIRTDTKDLKGKHVTYDVHTLFHRHYGNAVIEAE